jgi:hypothetical protein
MLDDSEPETSLIWLAKKNYDECSLQFRTVWDLYLKFYVMFMTVNVTALGLTVQYVHTNSARMVIAIAFVMQNVLSALTAAVIARYSSQMATKVSKLAAFIVENTTPAATIPPILAESPIPGHLGEWSALANAVAHVVYSLLWIFVIDFPGA